MKKIDKEKLKKVGEKFHNNFLNNMKKAVGLFTPENSTSIKKEENN